MYGTVQMGKHKFLESNTAQQELNKGLEQERTRDVLLLCHLTVATCHHVGYNINVFLEIAPSRIDRIPRVGTEILGSSALRPGTVVSPPLEYSKFRIEIALCLTMKPALALRACTVMHLDESAVTKKMVSVAP